MKAAILAACMALMAGCSDSEDGTAGGTGGAAGGAGGSGGGATGGTAGGSSCSTVPGTYVLSGQRDATNPGSCPNSLTYPVALIATLAKSDSGADYTFGLYAKTVNNPGVCAVNVTGCGLNSTCPMIAASAGSTWFDASWQSEMVWTITEAGASGSDKWTNYKSNTQMTACSANWLLTATRQ